MTKQTDWNWTGGKILHGDECSTTNTLDCYGKLFEQFGRDIFLRGWQKKASRMVIRTYVSQTKTDMRTGDKVRKIFLEVLPVIVDEGEI